jgi:hypothetical protein
VHTSNSVVKGLLGKVACLVGGVQDLVVEDGEVEGKAKADWVGGSQVCLSNLGSVLVSLEGLVGGLLSLVANGELSEVAVVITLPTCLLDTRASLGRGAGGFKRTFYGRRPLTRRS